MLQGIILNYTFNQEGIRDTKKYWTRKCTNKCGRTVNRFHFREVRN